MSAKNHNIRIGIFVLTGVGLLIAGLMAFGAKNYFSKKYTYETAIGGEVTGLSVGSIVLLRGVPIGKVSHIDFAPNRYQESKSDMIIVEFQLDRHVFIVDMSDEERARRLQEQIAKGLRAMVKLQGVTGSSVLSLEQLDPGKNPPPELDYKPRNPYVPSAPGQFTRILESIEESLQNLQKLDFQSIGIGLSNTLAQATHLVAEVNRIDLEKTVGKVDGLLDNLGTLSGNANNRLVELKDTNVKLQNAIDHIGTVPLKQTVDDLRVSLQTLNEVLLELKQYPSGFILGEPPLPAKSVKTPAK